MDVSLTRFFSSLTSLSLYPSQDTEVLRAWLADLHFEEYYNLFIQDGYDMPTISRMTPEVSSTRVHSHAYVLTIPRMTPEVCTARIHSHVYYIS